MGAPAPSELLRWEFAEIFGWTLEYVDGLSMKQVHQYLEIKDARKKARSR